MADQNSSRGREAEKPQQFNKAGWRDILLRVKNRLGEDNINIIAAGVAFFAFLAIFPAIAALISIYGLIIDPQQVQQQLQSLTQILPSGAQQLIEQQLRSLVSRSSGALGWSLLFSILLALWSANAGTKALFRGLNIAYNETRNRGLIKENAVSLLFTLYLILVVIVSMVLIVAFPVAVVNLGLPGWAQTLIGFLRWVFLLFIILFTLAAMYRFGPVRENPKWRWVSWGATLATVLWLVGSWLFSIYVSNFSNYSNTYGSLAAVVILLFWFLLSSFIILLGALINAEMESQTAKDTTTGPRKPMGKRGANPADNLGESP